MSQLSLQYAKYEMFKHILTLKNIWNIVDIYSNVSRASTNDDFIIKLESFDARLATSVFHTTLKYEDKNGKQCPFIIRFPSQFFCDEGQYARHHKNKTYYTMSQLYIKWKAYVFDQLCEASINGMKLVIVKKFPKLKKSEVVTIIDAYEGAKMQIEADLKAPDYAYLDECEKSHSKQI